MAFLKQRLIGLAKRLAFFAAVVLVLMVVFDMVIMPLYVEQGKTTQVPDVMGMPIDSAISYLDGLDLQPKRAEIRFDRQYPESTVAAQNPPAGAVVKFGRGVYLTVSGGEPMADVPSLRGRSLRDATLALEGVGLRAGHAAYQVSIEYPENTVIEQSIMEGTRMPVRTAVHLTVSQGPSADRVPVPNVLNRSLSDAERIILQSGLVVGTVTYAVSLDLLPNTVVDQAPKSDGFLPQGSPVDLFVSKKPEGPIPVERD
jgi:beta-lactam-binding protein with PASTA domain